MDIAALIVKPGNSDWVRRGRVYLEQALETLFKDYDTEARRLLGKYDEMAAASYRFSDRTAFEKNLRTLRVTLEANVAAIKRKKENPGLPVSLEISNETFEVLDRHIDGANEKAEEHNDTVKI